MESLPPLIIGSLIFGFVGMLIADHRNASKVAGFWLGFFLWPIGLVIAAILEPSEETSHRHMPSSRSSLDAGSEIEADLNNAKYKVWLIDVYGIEKNDVLGEYICGKKSFGSIDEALAFAHKAEVETRERRVQEVAELDREADEVLENWRRQSEQEERLWIPIVLMAIAIYALGYFFLFEY